jgi:hypothetical protein
MCTHLGKIKAHNHSLGNDLADTLAYQVGDGHPPDTTYTVGSNVSIGQWPWPYTLIPQTPGDPMPYRYTNLKNRCTHMQHQTHTHTPLANNQRRCPPRQRRGIRSRLHIPQKAHNTLQYPIHSQARIHVGRTQHPPPHPQPHPVLPHVWPIHQQRPHGR